MSDALILHRSRCIRMFGWSAIWRPMLGLAALASGLTVSSDAAATDPQPPNSPNQEQTYRYMFSTPAMAALRPADTLERSEARPRGLADNQQRILRHFVHSDARGARREIRPELVNGAEPLNNVRLHTWVRFDPSAFNTEVVAPARAGLSPLAAGIRPEFCATEISSAQASGAPAAVAAAWDNAYKIILHYAHCGSRRTLMGSYFESEAKLEVVEPSIVSSLSDREESTPPPPWVEKASAAWPSPKNIDPKKYPDGHFWHRASGYSGLDDALDLLVAKMPQLKSAATPRILIAHLDTGFPGKQSENLDPIDRYLPLDGYPMPPNFHPELSADCYEPYLKKVSATGTQPPCSAGNGNGVDISDRDPKIGKTSWFLTNKWHGAGTLSILAGGFRDESNPACAASSQEHWGANPCAGVFEVRVSQSFAHFNEETMAIGIQYAIEHNADVISLSHGGVPAAILEEEVNVAYNAGVPIFAASGDYFGTLLLSTPKTTVFPARYNQVFNVTGADAAYLSAGRHCFLLTCVWHFWSGNGFKSNFFDWLVGTNYGPTDLMAGHSIAAYTPNITYFSTSPDARGLSDNENGTSAAVPQVAAAAAMWLELNRGAIQADAVEHNASDPDSDPWRSWRKTEAVYQALLHATSDQPSGHNASSNENYKSKFYGAGILDATKLLSETYQPLKQCDQRPPSHADLYWWLDALTSVTIFDVVDTGAQVSPSSDEAAAVQDALKASLLTELTQLTFRNQKLQSYLATLTAQLQLHDTEGCVVTHPDLSPITQAQWRRVQQFIASDHYASNGIRRAALKLAN